MKQLFLIALLYPATCAYAKHHIDPADIDAIILDLNDVLIKENVSAFIKELGGFSNVASYVITHWKNPADRALDALEQMNRDDRAEIVWGYKGRQMPGCVVNWYIGKAKEEYVKNQLLEYVETLDQRKFFKSRQEKELIVRMMHCAFDHEKMPGLIRLIEPMPELVTELKRKGHKIYLCANLAPEPYEIFKATFPQLAEQFDGVAISGYVQQLKPDKKMFEHLIKTYNLQPQRCLYVDAQKESLNQAERMGLRTVKFSSASHLKKQLRHYRLV